MSDANVASAFADVLEARERFMRALTDLAEAAELAGHSDIVSATLAGRLIITPALVAVVEHIEETIAR